jgi:hypothetical protein
LKSVYEDLGSRVAREREKREVTTWTTMGAPGFILAGSPLSAIWFRRIV